MNRPEIIHEMNKFLLILFVLTASILLVAFMGIDNHNYTAFNQQLD